MAPRYRKGEWVKVIARRPMAGEDALLMLADGRLAIAVTVELTADRFFGRLIKPPENIAIAGELIVFLGTVCGVAL